MGLQASKLNIIQKLMGVTNESLLKKVNTLLDDELIVGYTVDGKPLTKKM